MDAIEFDITKNLNQFNKLANSMTFIISKSINSLAFEQGRKAVSKEMNKEFNTTNKYFNSPNAIRIMRANKNKLEVTLYHFKEELGLQQFGGIETPKGNKLAIPVRKSFKKYANVPNNKAIPKSLKIDTIMKKAPRNRGDSVYKARGIKPFINKRGVFIRTDEGLKLLYVFADKAEHRNKMLNMQKVIENVYNIKIDRYLNREYLKLLKG